MLWSTLRDDFTRHGSSWKNLAFWAVAVYHFGVWAQQQSAPVRFVCSKIYAVMFLFVEMSSGITLNREARIGAALHLPHAGNIKVHPASVIGDRCTLFHDVTLGTNMERDDAPVLGDDVFVGAGAKILGPVKIGNGARVAANSLVITDVPAGATAIGVPARAMKPQPGPPSAPSGETKA